MSVAHGGSPGHLIASTISNELRLASGLRSRVMAITLKDQAAILPGGHTAKAAYSYDRTTDRFVSSTYYMSALPSWVAKFNDEPRSKAYRGKAWQALPETPGGEGQVFAEIRLDAPETCPNQQFLQRIDNTPLMNEIELWFALEAGKNEHLGQEKAADFLTVGVSVNGYIGHRYGPYSPQVADLTFRTDRHLAEFLHELDHLVGLDNVWIAFSSDHGVAPTPQFIAEHRLGIGNFPRESIEQAAEDALFQAYGRREWILTFTSNNIHLNHPLIREGSLELSRVESTVAEATMSVDRAKAAFTRSRILTGNLPSSPLAQKVSAAFKARRSGNVVLVLEPFAPPGIPETQATRGSVWNYDAQVPMLLWGEGIQAGSVTHAL